MVNMLLKTFVSGLLIILSMKGHYSLHTTVVIMMPIIYLSYLITNGEYPEILAKGGQLLEIKIKTDNAKLIDSCCFITMPLSRFSGHFQYTSH